MTPVVYVFLTNPKAQKHPSHRFKCDLHFPKSFVLSILAQQASETLLILLDIVSSLRAICSVFLYEDFEKNPKIGETLTPTQDIKSFSAFVSCWLRGWRDI